jgi:hypothetical protein
LTVSFTIVGGRFLAYSSAYFGAGFGPSASTPLHHGKLRDYIPQTEEDVRGGPRDAPRFAAHPGDFSFYATRFARAALFLKAAPSLRMASVVPSVLALM